MAGVVSGRALHFVLKIGNRKANYDFFTQVLGMKVGKSRNNFASFHRYVLI